MTRTDRLARRVEKGKATNQDLVDLMLEIEAARYACHKLAAFIVHNPGDERCGAAIWALGKAQSKTHKDTFVQAMKDSLDRDQNALYQAMVALDNLGENVFCGNCSSIGTEENREIAERWLKARSRKRAK